MKKSTILGFCGAFALIFGASWGVVYWTAMTSDKEHFSIVEGQLLSSSELNIPMIGKGGNVVSMSVEYSFTFSGENIIGRTVLCESRNPPSAHMSKAEQVQLVLDTLNEIRAKKPFKIWILKANPNINCLIKGGKFA